MASLLRRHMTILVFTIALLGGIGSLALPFLIDERIAVGLLGLSVLFSIGAIWTSEHRGFVRTTHMRRAFEPQRHFGAVQVLVLVLLLLAQIGLTTYYLIT